MIRHIKQGLIFLGWFAVCMSPAQAMAGISEGFPSKGEVAPGMLVSWGSGAKSYVVPATTGDQNILGVAVGENQELIALATQPGNVQVVSSGAATVLVNDAGGPIKSGDAIALSEVAGLGMKASGTARRLGFALETADFAAGRTLSARGRDGTTRTVKVKAIQVKLDLAAGQGSGWASQLGSAVAAVVGHEVSFTRIVVGGAILLIALIAAITIIYIGGRTSLNSIGRNPLAGRAIVRSFLLLLAVAGGVISAAVAVVYLILR